MKCIAQRLWSKVQPDPRGCWNWTGALNPNGYGYISTSTGMAYTHRVAAELFHGPIPDGMVADHLCRNRARWLGASIEADQFTWRANHLRATKAAVLWISAEPLLSGLPSLDLTGIDWVVVGGESGPGARPMDPDWARDLRDRCVLTTVRQHADGDLVTPHEVSRGPAFLFKQWGEWAPNGVLGLGNVDPKRERLVGGPMDEHGCRTVLERMGKKAAGRELDGRTWDEYPA